jgi:hypothetical protein
MNTYEMHSRLSRLEARQPKRAADLRESFPRLARVWSDEVANVMADRILDLATVADEIAGLEPAQALAAVEAGSNELAAQLVIDPTFRPDELTDDDETLTPAGRAFFGRFGVTLRETSA